MRKGFTLVEIAIVLFIVAAVTIIGYGAVNRIVVDHKCTSNGYVAASSNRYNRYCSKVVNGNTIVIHVDSLR